MTQRLIPPPDGLRHANAQRGQGFHDSSLGKVIRFDGRVWRDPANAAAV